MKAKPKSSIKTNKTIPIWIVLKSAFFVSFLGGGYAGVILGGGPGFNACGLSYREFNTSTFF